MPEYRGMNLLVPEHDSEYREYFALAAQGRLAVRRCADCGLLRYPPGAACPWCQSLAWTWQDVAGRGTIVSYELVCHAVQPGFRDWTPYAVVLVELDEQRGQPTPEEALRVVANLVTPDLRPETEENVAINKRVRVIFQPLSDDFALPQFTLSGEPPAGMPWRLPE
ncbi:MAG: OB-fold domain-containing protein [Chloroflexi bacterium]|nr:OB-fold domain-containing protein [Chloroflexota bacterium]